MDDRHDDTSDGTRRRNFLKATGVALTGGTFGTGPASASLDSRDQGPIKAPTTVVKRFEPEGEHYEVQKKAISPKFKDRFGGPVIHYEPEIVPREAIPDEYKDPDRPFTVQYKDELVVGTLEAHLRAERGTTREDGVRIQAQSYSGPKFVYQSATGANQDDIYERTAPINVAWGTSLHTTAGGIKSFMQDRGWTKCICMPGSSTRYILYNGSARGQDHHIYNEIFLTEQWHIRVWDVIVDSSMELLIVIGNVHKDPYDHNLVGDSPWHFNEARDNVTGDWESWGRSSQSLFMGYTMWQTHDGNIGVVTA